MGTKIVSVTIEKTYTKLATIEVKVDDSLVDDELRDYLTESEQIDTLLEKALADESFVAEPYGAMYKYQDPTNNDGGHL